MAQKSSADFVTAFPEFGDEARYPLPTVNFWLTAAYVDLNAARFQNDLDLAALLFTAHMLSLSRRAEIASAHGQPPGALTGTVTSRSVDKVSVSYDLSLLTEKGMGFWSMTSYGLRLWWLFRRRLLGPVYAPGCSRPTI